LEFQIGLVYSRKASSEFLVSTKVCLLILYSNLEPGGYIEVADIAFPVQGIDKSIDNTNLQGWSNYLLKVSDKAGTSLGNAKLHKKRLENAGFENVVEKTYRWPQNRWPKDRDLKDIGMYTYGTFGEHFSSLSMALLTREDGWKEEEVEMWSIKAKNDAKNVRVHAYWEL
jgi:hypothetical protein